MKFEKFLVLQIFENEKLIIVKLQVVLNTTKLLSIFSTSLIKPLIKAIHNTWKNFLRDNNDYKYVERHLTINLFYKIMCLRFYLLSIVLLLIFIAT